MPDICGRIAHRYTTNLPWIHMTDILTKGLDSKLGTQMGAGHIV